ncbi:hypothetical protein [Streptomyces sp. NPDC051079]|uniref:hypothetical protein n=1 Tax=Streptomyces sp. NPDC051079 TaxID=3155043 RepID=UPI00344CE530
MTRHTRESIRARLVVASDTLRPDNPLLADAVDEILAPGGWQLLKPPATATGSGKNIAMPMPSAIRDDLKAASTTASLSADANEALTKFLAGEFVPPTPARARRNSGATADTVNLNVRVDADLVQKVTDIAAERSDEYGWKVTPARIAAAYLLQKHEISTAK